MDGQAFWFLRTDELEVFFQGHIQDFFVEKEDGAEGLVLSGRGDISLSGKIGKKVFQVLSA